MRRVKERAGENGSMKKELQKGETDLGETKKNSSSHLLNLFIISTAQFTTPSVMCCPWLELKEELEAIGEDPGTVYYSS